MRWLYYSVLAWKDLTGLRRMLLLQTAVLTGLALPVLLLAGLKRGHVEQLSHALRTSPSGRFIQVVAAMKGKWLSREEVDDEVRNDDGIQVAIPDIQAPVILRRIDESGHVLGESRISLYSTRPGDPHLAFYDADACKEGERAVVITSLVSEELGIKVGDTVQLSANRRNGESHVVDVAVKAIFNEKSDSRIGYADLWLVEQLQYYLDGSRVPELGWPAIRESAPDRYTTFLLFCRQNSPLDESDRRDIQNKGFIIKEVTEGEIRSLFGLISTERQAELICYSVESLPQPDNKLATFPVTPEAFTSKWTIRTKDDVALAWPKPRPMLVDSIPVLGVGLMLPKRNWLRHTVLSDPELPFAYGAEELSYRAVGALAETRSESSRRKCDFKTLLLELNQDYPSAVSREEDGMPNGIGESKSSNLSEEPANALSPDNNKPSAPFNLAVLPPALLAHLDAVDRGDVEFDPSSGIFVSRPRNLRFSKMRVYAKTIYDVPKVVQRYLSQGYAPDSKETQIREIEQQDASLSLIVYVVAAVVCLVCFLTVGVLLSDVTDRKKSELGMLRVMGVSAYGIFYICVLRALLILCFGFALACVLSVVLGVLLPFCGVGMRIELADVRVVAIALTIASVLGAIVPAWLASRCDPIETVIEGRFR